jgi:hypothetical protein
MNTTISRRTAIAALSTTALLARRGWSDEPAAEVPWLAEIQQRPEKLPETAPKLTSLLGDAKTRDAWEKRRDELRRLWNDVLGPAPTERTGPPKFTILEEDTDTGIIRRRIRYETEPGEATEAYLLLPKKLSERAPGVAAFHSTFDQSLLQPAGLAGSESVWFGLRAAQRGCVAICPRNFLWPKNQGIAAKQEAERYLKRHPKSTGMRKMLHDAQVAVDVLASLPEVDAKRLGAVGHSLGAKEVLYLAAFDERIKATASSEGGIGIKFSNWDAPWYLGDQVHDAQFEREHHELLGLIAPRPFLLLGGAESGNTGADGDQGWPFIEQALSVYELYGRPCRVGQYNHRQGHAVPPEAVKRIDQWLATYL